MVYPVPNTLVRTSHALTIKANGVDVGLINGWNPSQGRTITPIFEVGVDGSGNPIENMPGNITGLQVSINRFDTYKERMETAFGTPDLTMLTRQNQPFVVKEVWLLSNGSKERYVYDGCWFSSIGRSLRSDDARTVNVNATIIYTKKIPVLEAAFGSTLVNLIENIF